MTSSSCQLSAVRSCWQLTAGHRQLTVAVAAAAVAAVAVAAGTGIASAHALSSCLP